MFAQRLTKHLLIAAVLLLAVNIIITMALNPPTSSAQVSSRQKTLYKVAHVRDNEQEIQTVVDIFARDGWELVTYSNGFVIFKKQ
jgi:Na+-transporting NADH:ubiquinone oxidoreductase subunit NqrC